MLARSKLELLVHLTHVMYLHTDLPYHSLLLGCLVQPPEFHQEYRLVQLQGDGLQHAPERNCHWATVIESQELLTDAADGSSTKLVRLDISEVRSSRQGHCREHACSILTLVCPCILMVVHRF